MDRASHRPLIAIVDDNDDNCVLLHALLDDRYDLTVFHDGLSALQRLEQEQPHLALLDVSLPGMDGVEVLHRMRRLPGLELVPAIALTAHTMPGDRERLLAAGFDDYVSKPIVEEEVLYAAIERLLARSAPGGAS